MITSPRRLIRCLAVGLLTVGCTEPAATSGSQARLDCDHPAPSTPADYQTLWSTVDPDQWGAGDVSLSVPMGPQRWVWLYGDTLSNGGRLVHSSAITQVGGCLHVSRHGAQVLPDIDATHVFWIHAAWRVRHTDRIRIKARAIELTGQGPWAFHDGGYFRIATVRLEPTGDLTFGRWGRRWTTPEPDMGPLVNLGGDSQGRHFGYSIRRHRLLPDGSRLTTMCQSWEGPLRGGWDNYRPIFYRSTP